MAGGKGWDLHVKVEPAKEERKDDEGGGGDSTWVVIVLVLGLLLLLLVYGHQGSRLWGGGGGDCSGAQHPGYSCASGDRGRRWDGSGHDRP